MNKTGQELTGKIAYMHYRKVLSDVIFELFEHACG